MEKPLPFLIEINGQLNLNEGVIKLIEKSLNPQLLLFYGTTRQGKSTTLNQIIKGSIGTLKFINRSPFPTQTSQNSLTVGCDIYGPIRCSEIARRHRLNINLNEDFDIFFCDTEGLFSLNGQSRVLIPGILTLLQVCTFSVIMINSVPDTNNIKQISAEIQFSKILQQMNGELLSPLVTIYISGYQIDIEGINDFYDCLKEYEINREQTADLILKEMNDHFPHLKITKKDFRVIPGGPYIHNFSEEPDHNDLKVKLYWNSITDIVKEFIKFAKNRNNSGDKLISLMKIVFNIFKEFKEIPRNPNLSNVLLKYLADNFDKFSAQQFKKISEEIKNDLKNNYEEYYRMLYNNDAAIAKLNICIEKNMIEIYKTLIPDKMQTFLEKSLLILRNSIETQIEKEFEIHSKIIRSHDFINKHIIYIKNEIDKAEFREDINMNIVNTYKDIWN